MSCGDKLTDEQIADIIYRYYQQEQSMASISRETGISYTTVRRHVNEYWRKEQHKRK
jgi:lambda repressor-like predicted transcriptional regulator